MRPTAVAVLTVVIGLLGLQPAVGQQFDRHQIYLIGSSPVGAAAGDFNGDGRCDVAIGNNINFKLSVLFAGSSGLVGPVVSVPTPSDIPKIVRSGDLNADGYCDLVFNNAGGVGVVYGRTDGTFSEMVHYGSGLAEDIAVSDINGDGRLDMVWTPYDWLTGLHILYAQPDGGYTAEGYIPTSTRPSGVAVADISHDGRMDVAVANEYDGTVSVYRALDEGYERHNYGAFGRPTGMITGDFNRDGYSDLAYAEFAYGGVGVMLGQPDGGLSAALHFAGQPSSCNLASGDFNRDGILDLAIAEETGRYVTVLMGAGDGTFGKRQDLLAMANGTASVAVGDYDGNGWDDIVVASASGEFIDIYYNTPEPASLSMLALGGLLLMRRRWRPTAPSHRG